MSAGAATAWDVAVVGAGPAGTMAALAAARAGARVVFLDRAAPPRYKTCAGGLTGRALRALNGLVPLGGVPCRDVIRRVRFSDDGRRARQRGGADARGGRPLLAMTQRPEFDAWLVDRARAQGAACRWDQVRGIDEADGLVALALQDGEVVRARAVVGADGCSGRLARYVGARYRQVDLGLERELALGPVERRRWRATVALDWGPVPGAYAWLFPKGRTATVGVIGGRADHAALRAYLDAWVHRLRLDGAAVLRQSGHLTKTRAARSPLASRSGRVLLAGDAAGLVEPWTREGISYALKSGRLAGEAAAAVAAAGDDPAETRAAAAGYATSIDREIQPELDAGAVFLDFFRRHRHLVHAAVAGTPIGWAAFRRVCDGTTSLAHVLRHRPLRHAIGLLTPPRPVNTARF
ncbi:MAG: geranylgeranyl reductase family protein [Bifidobacteriaceae bacterium]|jgi:geranylgeranyl reductase family protein|nr:geranylgeranyl reductase family protein [Bifidobacteriaceae bacterium]